MSDDRLDRLDDPGELLFIYSQKKTITSFFWTGVNLYRIIADKFMDVEYIDEISVPDKFQNFSEIKFFKPYVNNDDVTYIGIVTVKGESYKFEIKNETLTYKEKVDYECVKHFNSLQCLENYEVVAYIQKKK